MSDEFYCRTHKTVWFKRGKMRGYAHPIGDSGEWCNMPEVADGPDSCAEKAAVIPPAQPIPERIDTSYRSIERRIALEQAVELSGYYIAKGEKVGTRAILLEARAFAAWLADDIVPEKPEKKQDVVVI